MKTESLDNVVEATQHCCRSAEQHKDSWNQVKPADAVKIEEVPQKRQATSRTRRLYQKLLSTNICCSLMRRTGIRESVNDMVEENLLLGARGQRVQQSHNVLSCSRHVFVGEKLMLIPAGTEVSEGVGEGMVRLVLTSSIFSERTWF